jgi:hypothetical protein
LWHLLYGMFIEVKKDRTSHYTSAFFWDNFLDKKLENFSLV